MYKSVRLIYTLHSCLYKLLSIIEFIKIQLLTSLIPLLRHFNMLSDGFRNDPRNVLVDSRVDPRLPRISTPYTPRDHPDHHPASVVQLIQQWTSGITLKPTVT